MDPKPAPSLKVVSGRRVHPNSMHAPGGAATWPTTLLKLPQYGRGRGFYVRQEFPPPHISGVIKVIFFQDIPAFRNGPFVGHILKFLFLIATSTRHRLPRFSVKTPAMPFQRRAIEGQSRARIFREIAERSTSRLAQLSMGDRIALK